MIERMGKEAARLQAEIEALLTKAGMVDAEFERWGDSDCPSRQRVP